VVFGAWHRPHGRIGGIFPHGRWATPLGEIKVDQRMAERITGHTNLIADDPFAHEDEHSIEVQIPFVQRAFGEAKLVPIVVPCVPEAVEMGEAVARTIESYRYNAVIVGSTDLTHYGPRYRFTPSGVGDAGLRWAREVNDRRIIDLMLDLRAEDVVDETLTHHNACGGGAIAATLAAVRRLGATHGILLEHTTSSEVARDPSCRDAVGYAGIVFAGERTPTSRP
jgi:AmmeMemoRadiSam system protein B